MKRLVAVLVIALGVLASTRAQTPADKKATILYLRGLQTKGGGFVPAKPAAHSETPGRPSLRATAAASRALQYFGGEVADRKAARKYVESCFDGTTGAFVDNPSDKESGAVITAIGLMAVVELKMPGDMYAARAIGYLDGHAKSFEEIRMAAAALETIGKQTTRTRDWIARIAKMRNEDGTYGRGSAIARDTGSSVVAVLRLGGKVEHRDRVVKALKGGQRRDGGFGKADMEGSDLESCYRVVRAFVMLKEKPADVAALLRFVGKCRNRDGGYGIAPGKASAVGPTYFAAIILHWLAEK